MNNTGNTTLKKPLLTNSLSLRFSKENKINEIIMLKIITYLFYTLSFLTVQAWNDAKYYVIRDNTTIFFYSSNGVELGWCSADDMSEDDLNAKAASQQVTDQEIKEIVKEHTKKKNLFQESNSYIDFMENKAKELNISLGELKSRYKKELNTITTLAELEELFKTQDTSNTTNTSDPNNMPSDPNNMPSDPNSMPSDPNSMPSDPNSMPSDPNSMLSDPNSMLSDPNSMPSKMVTNDQKYLITLPAERKTSNHLKNNKDKQNNKRPSLFSKKNTFYICAASLTAYGAFLTYNYYKGTNSTIPGQTVFNTLLDKALKNQRFFDVPVDSLKEGSSIIPVAQSSLFPVIKTR